MIGKTTIVVISSPTELNIGRSIIPSKNKVKADSDEKT